MKTLLLLIVVGAIAAFAGAFFEMWKIPRFENIPTISDYSDSSKKPEKKEEALKVGPDKAPWGGPLAPKENNGARSRQVQESEKLLSQ
ncbi:MAG: hypothetical protein ACSHX0_09930 [Akkermansiaceae bacterium]